MIDLNLSFGLETRGRWIFLLSAICLLCCGVSAAEFLILPHAGLPADYRATICVAFSRDPIGFSLRWISPNLTTLPKQPFIVSNRIDLCLTGAWLPLLSRRGGIDLRQ